MALVATEQNILKVVAELKEASFSQINRHTGLSFGYVEYLCSYLARKGYLKSLGHSSFSLAPEGKKIVASLGDGLGLDRESVKEIASLVAKEIAKKIMIKGASGALPRRISREEERKKIEIKTDYSLPVDDESVGLESNISKLGVKIEKEESDIDKSVELFRKIQKRRKK